MLIEAIFTAAVLAGAPSADPRDCGADGLRYALKHASAEAVVAELALRFPVAPPGNGDPRANGKRKGLAVRAVAIPASNEVLVTTRLGAGSAVRKIIKQFDAARGPITP